MNQGWEIKKLGEVGTFQRGGGFLKSDFVENGFPCIHYGQIHTRLGVKTYKHLTCITEELAFSKSKIAHSGDVIIAITSEDVEGSCKCTAWLGGYDVAVGAHAAIYRHNLNPAFVAYYFNGAHFNFEKIKYARGFKVVEIKPSDIEKISIKFPSLEEQERIVAELDCLSGIIERKREQLRELDALAQSIFYQMFGDPITNEKGWKVKKLGEIATSQIGITYKPENVSDNDEGTIVLRSSNIQDNTLCFEDIVRVKCAIKENKYVKDGDILMCSRNGSFRLVGKVAMIANLPESMTYGAFMTIIRSPYQAYLFAFFKSPAFRAQLTTSKTATINQITVKMLDEIKVALPPLTLQQEFADKIEAIEKQKELIKQSITQTEELFNSRMDYYFN